jgi:hypothetical protein
MLLCGRLSVLLTSIGDAGKHTDAAPPVLASRSNQPYLAASAPNAGADRLWQMSRRQQPRCDPDAPPRPAPLPQGKAEC